MVMLGIDLGDTRTGIAICDKLQMLATPLCVIKETYQPKLIEEIKKIAVKQGASKIVMGLPRNMDGSYGPRAEKYLEFSKILEIETGLPVIMCDERLTTVEAARHLSANNTFGKKRKETIDATSAVIILQSYLDKT